MSVAEDAPSAPVDQALEEESPPLIDIGYPLRLGSTEHPIEAQTNLTANEFWALQNMWSFIKSRWHRFALELYIEFYTENHDHINRFRNKKSGKICTVIFSEHGKIIFQLFREVIENGLQNWLKSMNRINALSKTHVTHGISLFDITLIADAFKQLILEKCEGITTPTVFKALDKLCQEIFQQHKARELIGDDDVSMEIDEGV